MLRTQINRFRELRFLTRVLYPAFLFTGITLVSMKRWRIVDRRKY
jgi:hypothetical protein